MFLEVEKYKSLSIKMLFGKYEQIEENHIGEHAKRNNVISRLFFPLISLSIQAVVF